MIGHPREEMLLAFQDHRLDDRRRRRLAEHLSGCQRCRNVVQAHRTVRGVFACEAPFAPDGVLERALASRAAGMIVVLPVAEPDATPRMALPRRGFVIAAGMVLTVLAGVQLVPTTRLKQMWSAWSGMIVEWQPFGRESALDLIYPRPPVARAAVIDPARVRPLHATYRWHNLRDGKVEGSHTYSLELTRGTQAWRARSIGPGERTWSAVLSDSLKPASWFIRSTAGKDLVTESSFTFWNDSLRQVQRLFLNGKPVEIGNEYAQPFDSTWDFTPRFDRPVALGEAHLFLLFSGISIRRGWVGSIDYRFSPRYWRWDAGQPTTYLAVAETTMTTLAGSFEVWELNELHVGAIMRFHKLWISKDNGLVIKSTTGDRRGSETILESVTYP